MPSTEVPTDDGREIPGLAVLARTTTRLHPRPGTPTAGDSHIGGPLLWPAHEAWPRCDGVLPTSTGRPQQEWAAEHDLDEPVVLVGAAQFFRHDFPDLPFPDGTDVLQVLLCPNEHDGSDYYGPAAQLVWRDSASVTDVVTPPRPTVAEAGYLPAPCVLNTCQTVEFPALSELPAEITSALSFFDENGYVVGDYDRWPEVAHGSKLGGWAFWWQTEPWQHTCTDCDAKLVLLLSLHTYEHKDELCPCEQNQLDPVGWVFGRDGALNIFTCPRDISHPFQLHID